VVADSRLQIPDGCDCRSTVQRWTTSRGGYPRDRPDAGRRLIFCRTPDLTISPELVGTQATETALVSQAEQSEILHLATHGEFDSLNPQFSRLRLNPDETHSDGSLYVHEIYGLDLTSTTNLVVLSACQSQVGQLSRGDEIVGLSRAFLYAGTPTVMASLWNIDDAATSYLMERFYTYLQEDQTTAKALQLAQQDTRENYPHPYYWGAFVLTGIGE
jgi:CHAT domain-containing protein